MRPGLPSRGVDACADLPVLLTLVEHLGDIYQEQLCDMRICVVQYGVLRQYVRGRSK